MARPGMFSEWTKSSEHTDTARTSIVNEGLSSKYPSTHLTTTEWTYYGEEYDEYEDSGSYAKPATKKTRKLQNLTTDNVFRVYYEDAVDLEGFVTDDTMDLFNEDSVYKMIHDSYLGLIVRDDNMEALAFVCFSDYPNLQYLGSTEWEYWIEALYGLVDVTQHNTLFVRFAVYDKLYAETFMSTVLTYVFQRHVNKEFIIAVIPPMCSDKMNWLKTISTSILPIGFTTSKRVQGLRLMVRHNFVNTYKIRRAVEEDNDDLVPLINNYSTRLKEIYGEYYIAEIITRHADSGRQIIVAEYKGEAVAVLCLNETINYEELRQAFDLEVFTQLRKPILPKFYKYIESDVTVSVTDSIRMTPIQKGTIDDGFQQQVQRIPGADTNTMSYYGEGYEPTDVPPRPVEVDADGSWVMSFGSSGSNISIDSDKINVSHKSTTTFTSETMDSTDLSKDSEILAEKLEGYLEGPNAFAIEIVACRPEHTFSLYPLLTASFECFPTKDYCILTIPSEQPYFPLLEYFIRVTPKNRYYHPHELYIVHRCTKEINVRQATIEDLDKIEEYSRLLKHPGQMIRKFYETITDPTSALKTYIFLIDKESMVVGITMVNEITDLDLIKNKYSVRSVSDIFIERNEDVGAIEYFSLLPIFRRRSRHLLRHVHNQSQYTTLFYAMNHSDSDYRFRVRPMPSIVIHLMHVPPRKIAIDPKLEENIYKEEPFSLYISTRKLSCMHRFEISNRMVIVGASHTAIGFLRGLLLTRCQKYQVTFNNITLIAPHGFCYHKKLNNVQSMLRASCSTLNYDYMEKINLRCHINVIYGFLTSIDRKEKTIMVNKRINIPYDKLFLMCGIQYGTPRKPNVQEYLKVRLPDNMFLINTEMDAIHALENLKQLIYGNEEKIYNIMVYGYNLDVYCCVSALLEYGVPGNCISLVEPYPPEKDGELHHDFIFQDGDIFSEVILQLKCEGVMFYTGYKMIDWIAKEFNNTIAVLESKLRFIEMECLAGFIYAEKSVNVKAFQAIINSGLVYDGRLVINADCQTNDPNIYAAGKLTKYSKRYCAERLNHKYFNVEEIGKRLGKTIRQQLVPFAETEDDNPNIICMKPGQIPVYEKPLLTHCHLLDMYYVHVCKPGPVVPWEAAMSDDDYGTILVTGKCNSLEDQGYFRIHITPIGIIETITCLSKEKINYRKLMLIWGKHTKMLNNLLMRFETGNITDLYEFFSLPWCSAIFHDDFSIFENKLMKIMRSISEHPNSSPIEDLMKMLTSNNFKALPNEQFQIIKEKFKGSQYEEAIQDLLLDFIRENLQVLDMYAHPIIVRYILAGYEASPLFQPKES